MVKKMDMLEKLRNAFRRKKTNDLKRISNQAIEKAAMREDPRLVNISLIAYALYKLLSKQHVLESDQWEKFSLDVDAALDKAISAGAAGGLEEEIIRDIARIDESLGNYTHDIIEKARTKQASRIYAMGLSMDKAIALTGADRFELLSYVGSTTIHDRKFSQTKKIVDRYQFTKRLLEGKLK